MAAKPRDSCVLPMHGCWSGSLNSLQAKRSKRLRILYPVSDDSMSIDHETENFSFKKKIWRASDRRRRQKLPSRPCRGAPLLCRRTASCSACLLPLQRRSRTTLTAVRPSARSISGKTSSWTAAASSTATTFVAVAARSGRCGGPRSGMEWPNGVEDCQARPGRPFPVRSRRDIDLCRIAAIGCERSIQRAVSTVPASKNVAILKTRAPCVLDQRAVHGFLVRRLCM